MVNPCKHTEPVTAGHVEEGKEDNKATSSGMAVAGVSATPVEPETGAIVILGDQFGPHDALRYVLESLPRINTEGQKKLRPIIVESEAAKQALNAAIRNYETPGNAADQADQDPAQRQARAHALGNFKILTSAEVQAQQAQAPLPFKKLYVLGTALPNSAGIQTGGTNLTMEQVGTRLERMALLNQIKDIRIVADRSGESTEVMGGSIPLIGGAITAAAHYLGLQPSPLAQRLKNYISARGHSDVEVTGYRGTQSPLENRETHHFRDVDEGQADDVEVGRIQRKQTQIKF